MDITLSTKPPVPTSPNGAVPQPSTVPVEPPQPTKPPKSHKKLIISIIIILIILAAGAGAFAYHESKHPAQKQVHVSLSMSSKSASNKANNANEFISPPAVTDTWTGKGTDSNWSDAANWSSGVPQKHYNLVFADDISSSPVNDLTDLSIGSITFTGDSSSGAPAVFITGNPISIEGGITAQTPNASTIELNLPITLSGDQTFNGEFGTAAVTMGSYDLTLDGTTVDSLSGTGTLAVNNVTDPDSLIAMVNGDRPDFSGTTTVDGGILALNASNSFGSGLITVKNGAALRLVDSTNTSDSFTNNITLGGSGDMQGSTAASLTGAINLIAPLTSLTLSGKITLTSNAKVGVYNFNNTEDGPGTLTLSQPLVSNGYSLSGISSAIHVDTP